MRFHVASGHGEIVQTVKLHEWREHGHQHDQSEHDFWHLARHDVFRRVVKRTGHPFIGDCGDYSTAVIKCNNLNFIGLRMRLTGCLGSRPNT